jgi:glycosyltransferase involved in cell wall biosynthesis
VLYVGRFDRRKGIETLVRAIALSKLRGNSDLRLIIAGGFRPGESDGIECDRIHSIVKELGLDSITTFPGRLTESDLPIYYAAANVCVVPSHYEPFGLVAIEAMACRTPVIASKVGGLQFTVVPEITGLLVPPQDDFAFAQAIDRILSDPAWGDQLGQMARQRVEIAMSWDSVASRLGNLYNRLISQTAPISVKTSSGNNLTLLKSDVAKVKGSVA